MRIATWAKGLIQRWMCCVWHVRPPNGPPGPRAKYNDGCVVVGMLGRQMVKCNPFDDFDMWLFGR